LFQINEDIEHLGNKIIGPRPLDPLVICHAKINSNCNLLTSTILKGREKRLKKQCTTELLLKLQRILCTRNRSNTVYQLPVTKRNRFLPMAIDEQQGLNKHQKCACACSETYFCKSVWFSVFFHEKQRIYKLCYEPVVIKSDTVS